MLNPSNPYYRQVALLAEMLPLLSAEACFALKGGTAINLFLRDMPRLSVDIDLTYLPLLPRDDALNEMSLALERLADRIETNSRTLQVHRTRVNGLLGKLVVMREMTRVKIEVSPVLRGSVHLPRRVQSCAKVNAQFGPSEVLVLHAHDVYAGKLCAALDRQHPRDLFDVHQLLDHEGISAELVETFMVYLISSGMPMAELLAPNRLPIAEVFETQFSGMTLNPVTLAALEGARERMIALIHQHITDKHRAFLLSFKQGEPDWSLLNLSGVDELPAVQWKLMNIKRMTAAKHREAVARLEAVLSGVGHV